MDSSTFDDPTFPTHHLEALIEEHVAPFAARNDEQARFPEEGIQALGAAGLLGLTVPKDLGGLGRGPRAFAQTASALARVDASLAMVFTMHVTAASCIVHSPHTELTEVALREIAAGRHLTTLAFSERGSRSHFWAPVSQARRSERGIELTAHKSFVTSATHAASFLVSTRAPDAERPLDSTLYLVDAHSPGITPGPAWNGLGLRGNDSSPVVFDATPIPGPAQLSEDRQGLSTMLGQVLPLFCLGTAACSLGISQAAVDATVRHLRSSRLEHLNQTLGEAFPTLRARIARMRIETDGLATRIDDVATSLESPGPESTLKVLEAKAAANEAALRVTESAMRACGGAAFARQTAVDRFLRDAHAGAVMAPTVDQLHEFVGRALLELPLF